MFKGYIYKCTCVVSGELTFRGEPKIVNMYNEDGTLIDTGAELFRFNSATEAAKALNLDYRSISNCASGKYKYSGKIDNVKIVWKYLE